MGNPFEDFKKKKEGRPERPKIIRAIEDRSALLAKLKEYEDRLKKPLSPEKKIDTNYKIAIMKELVEKGEADTDVLAQRLGIGPETIENFMFLEACLVISDYIATGGKKVVGGTGLPRAKETGEEETN